MKDSNKPHDKHHEDNVREWSADAKASRTWDDPLLHCLGVLTRYWHRPHSEHALKAGLPLEDNRLTPELFIRAASRAGLSARIVQRPLKKISPLVLPATLLLKNRQACVLVSLSSSGDTAKMIFAESGSGASEISIEDLEETYLGYAIFVQPTFRYDARSDETPDVSP